MASPLIESWGQFLANRFGFDDTREGVSELWQVALYGERGQFESDEDREQLLGLFQQTVARLKTQAD